MNIPNFLTILRLFFPIFIGIVCYLKLDINLEKLVILVLFILFSLTDYFDGFLARKYNASSQMGEILDPIADKILIIFLFFGLALNLSSYLIGFAGSLIITREIWVSALRDFNSRNNSNATKVVYIAKIKTSIQLFTISLYLFALAFNKMMIVLVADIFMIISVLITLYTGYLYTIKTFDKLS